MESNAAKSTSQSSITKLTVNDIPISPPEDKDNFWAESNKNFYHRELSERSVWYTSVAEAYDKARPKYPVEILTTACKLAGLLSPLPSAKEPAEPPTRRRILEVGCGPGTATVDLARLLTGEKGFEIIALDANEAMCQLARQNTRDFPNVSILHCSYEEFRGDAIPSTCQQESRHGGPKDPEVSGGNNVCSSTLGTTERNASSPSKQERSEVDDDGSFDAIFAATSMHWFSREIAYPKSLRLLKDGGSLVMIFNYMYQPIEKQVMDDLWELYYERHAPEVTVGRYGTAEESIGRIRLFVDQFLTPATDWDILDFKCFPVRTELSSSEYCECLSTYSPYLCLPKEKREALFQGIIDYLDQQPFYGKVPVHYYCCFQIAIKKPYAAPE